jgi:hypothetical protein
MFDPQRNVMNNKDEEYGLTIPEGISFQTMTSGDPNSTAPQPDTIREILRAKVKDPSADMADRQAAQQVLRLSYNERLEIPRS